MYCASCCVALTCLRAMEVQVWGVGGAAAIEAATSAQGKARQIMAENIDKARKVRSRMVYTWLNERWISLGCLT
jgi:hypothetical protein